MSTEIAQAVSVMATMTGLLGLAVVLTRPIERARQAVQLRLARRRSRRQTREAIARERRALRTSSAYEMGRVDERLALAASLELEAATPQELEAQSDEAARQYLDASLYPMGGAHRRAA